MAENVFYRGSSWYCKAKVFHMDGTVTYTKKGGFATEEEAKKGFVELEQKFQLAKKSYDSIAKGTITFVEYLRRWVDDIFPKRAQKSSVMLANYIVYDILIPNIPQDLKLAQVTAEGLDEVLKAAATYNRSAGNSSRTYLNIAFSDAILEGYIKVNPVPMTKKYSRGDSHVQLLNKDQIKILLRHAKQSSGWYLEILLGLFMGLRKGEILGLKFTDFDFDKELLSIGRQITSNPIVKKGEFGVETYEVSEKEPKTENSYRTMRVPQQILEEVKLRKKRIDGDKEKAGSSYIDNGYISCTMNGLPHATASFNTALTKICKRCGLPHISVHSLRHMYATILLEQGVPLVKISALLGHSSINTTFEYYCDVMDENEKIIGFMNSSFMEEE